MLRNRWNVNTGRDRVLFVDDGTNVLDAMRRTLHEQESVWEMVFARGFDEAVAQLDRGTFNTVVADVRMPGKDAFSLLHAISKIAVPDAILQKPGPLTLAEALVMQEHCTIGAQILLQSPAGMKSFIQWQGRADEGPAKSLY